MSDQYNQPNNPAPYGYNPQTGQPNPAPQPQMQQPQITGYDPQTGQPIYAQPQMQQPQIVGYDPQTGQPIYAQQQPQMQQPQIIGYDPQTGQPIYGQPGQQPVYPTSPTIYDPKPPVKGTKPGGKKGLIAGLSVAAVAAIACFVIFVWPKPFGSKGGSGSSKAGPVETAIENTGKGLLGSSDLGDFFVDRAEEKSRNTGIGLHVTDIGGLISSFSGDSTYSMISGSGGMDFVVSPDGKKISCTMDVDVMGMAYSAQLYCDEDGLLLALPGLLSNTYSVPFKTAEQELSTSIFAPGSGSQYALDQNSYDQLIQAIQMMNKLRENLPNGNDIAGDIREQLEQQGLKPEFQTEKGSFTVDGETLNGTVATLDLDTEKMVQYVNFFKSYITDYVGKLQQSIPELSGELNLDDFDDIINQLRNDNICAHIELDIYNNYVVAMDIEIYDSANRSENSAHIKGEFGKDPSKSDHAVLYLIRGASEEYARVDYNISENSSSRYACTVVVTVQGTPGFTASFDWDKSSGNFNFNAMGMFTMNGNAKIDGRKLTMSLGEISIPMAGKSFDLSAIELTIDGDASLTKPSGAAKDIFKLTDADIQAIMTELQSNLGALANFMY
ncbi:MAG: hypothetical protein K6A77_05060 [Clostridiales bacterium]|nr:hypothetical protein [Clostridiales bacterium]